MYQKCLTNLKINDKIVSIDTKKEEEYTKGSGLDCQMILQSIQIIQKKK